MITGFAAVFTHGTLYQALIQREHDVEDAANTVLIVTFVTGLLLTLAVLVASPLIGALFHDSRVGLVAAASSGIMLLNSCPSVPEALMLRTFQFKRRVIISPAVALTFASVSIVFAVFGYGAWAMVIGTYASTTTYVLLSWWLAKWRPFRGRFSFRIWRELAGFSLPLLIGGIAEYSRQLVEQVLVGRALGTAGLGQFRYGYRIAILPSAAAVGICAHVLFPPSRGSPATASGSVKPSCGRSAGSGWPPFRSEPCWSRWVSQWWCCCSARHGAPPAPPPLRWREWGWVRRSVQ